MKDREEFCFVVARELPAATLQDARTLMQLARGIKRLNVLLCNQGLSDSQKHRAERLEDEAGKLALKMGALSANFSGDPRGYSLKIQLLSGKYNTMGGAEDGWGVPS